MVSAKYMEAKMLKKINILKANPAGNKTIFVLDHFERTEYKDIANKLLANKGIDAEQVGFITNPEGLTPGRMEMAGQEFCGNASRSYALYLAKLSGINGPGSVTIKVSGSDEPLEVEFDTKTNYTKISMPVPINIIPFPFSDSPDSQLVIFNGILHLVIFNHPATLTYFDDLISSIQKQYSAPAIGVMFYDTENCNLIPVVWVRDINSTFFEGSCGSGSVATATVLSENFKDGNYTFTLPQPRGTLEINIIKENNIIVKAILQGKVELDEVTQVEIAV
jgi:diaminopimelate epimerase